MKENSKRRGASWKIALLVVCGFMVSCAGPREHTRLIFSRYGDSLRVALDPSHSANWSPNEDSVVVRCTECYQNRSMVTLRFQDHSSAFLSSDVSPIMTFNVYHEQKLDTSYTMNAENFIDRDPATESPMPRHQTTPVHRQVIRTQPDESKKTPVVDTKTAVVAKKATMLRIIAKEGVAVYKDKSKREVIKILAQGATLPYLAREGDLYSVVIDDVEGFVEAGAVEVAP